MSSNELLIEIHYVCSVDSTEAAFAAETHLAEAVTLTVY
jgi:hypothetical protein